MPFGRVAEAVAGHVDQTRLGKDPPDAVWQAREALADDEEHIVDAAVGQFSLAVETRTSPTRPSLLPGQIPRMSLWPSRSTPIMVVVGLVADLLIPDLDDDRVDEDGCIDLLQRTSHPHRSSHPEPDR